MSNLQALDCSLLGRDTV